VEFFEKLREELLEENIELILIYGKLKNQDSAKNDERNLDWAIYRDNKIINISSIDFLWQPSLDIIPQMDLVIVEQANKLLINYLLIPLSKIMKFKFAFWGHGANLQDNSESLKNKFKYLFLTHSDYWFAYTNGVKKFLLSKGVHEKKITVVQNAIDTKTLRNQYINCSNSVVKKLKEKMNIRSNNIGIYCGGIYQEKRVDFLIEASIKIRKEIDDFHLIIIGAGSESFKFKEISQKIKWIHYLGSKFGEDRVPYFKISHLFLMPGLVGLAILDTFATETPMVTTDFSFHSPEIEYLNNNINGLITKNTIDDYSKEVIELLNNRDRLNSLKKGCIDSSSLYSIEIMVDNFKKGVHRCLNN
jgi:glycosyltransferase involved in cell wall biosynthesis